MSICQFLALYLLSILLLATLSFYNVILLITNNLSTGKAAVSLILIIAYMILGLLGLTCIDILNIVTVLILIIPVCLTLAAIIAIYML